MFSVLTTLILIIAVISGFMYVNQPGMIFFPIKELRDAPSNWGMQYEDVLMTTADDIELHGWYIPNQNSKKTLLFFHGNAGNISHRGESVKIFHDLGLNVFIFDYRGYGRSKGEPNEKGLYEDARTAWRYLIETKGMNGDSIILFGRSLGGAVATKLGSEVDASALGLIWPFKIIDPKSAIAKNTVTQIEKNIVKNYGVYRYPNDRYDGTLYKGGHRKEGAGYWPLLK